MHALGRFLVEEMNRLNLNPSTLATCAGLPRQTIYNLINDRREYMEQTPRRRTMEALAAALGIPEERILVAAARAIGVPERVLPERPDAGALSNAELTAEISRRFGLSSEAVMDRGGPAPTGDREHKGLD